MNINDAFPSKYLKASDLGDATPIVTIDHVTPELVGMKKEQKAVAYFVGKSKGLVLNKTNAMKIAAIAGTAETDEWSGIRVTLYVTETEFQGETVETIRVKVPKAAKTVETPKPMPQPIQPEDLGGPIDDDEIPF